MKYVKFIPHLLWALVISDFGAILAVVAGVTLATIQPVAFFAAIVFALIVFLIFRATKIGLGAWDDYNRHYVEKEKE